MPTNLCCMINKVMHCGECDTDLCEECLRMTHYVHVLPQAFSRRGASFAKWQDENYYFCPRVQQLCMSGFIGDFGSKDARHELRIATRKDIYNVPEVWEWLNEPYNVLP